MKLKTKGSPAKDSAHHGLMDDFIHDAAAAHALMQAISEWWGIFDEGIITKKLGAIDAILFIETRAEEIMREWGFES